MTDLNELVNRYVSAGGVIKIGKTRKALFSKTFRGRYTLHVAGVGRKSAQLRLQGYAKAQGH